MPMDERFDKDDIIARLDAGIEVQARTASIVRLRWRVRRGGAAFMPIHDRLDMEAPIAMLDAGTAGRGLQATCVSAFMVGVRAALGGTALTICDRPCVQAVIHSTIANTTRTESGVYEPCTWAGPSSFGFMSGLYPLRKRLPRLRSRSEARDVKRWWDEGLAKMSLSGSRKR